ncbi:major facilitator superfamily domain-containing protein [Aspergillus pseudoustus]|uniref:Major facilitator superfamily domain-containing protein n=1 Tax=Aspergillus pseudoustus TaxID=1810923 RepID=A0ABR4JH68_9EURO
MGLGVLETRSGSSGVPGTVALAETDGFHTEEDCSPRLKRGTGKDKHLILAPQPSDDPNDPLNWPYRKKVVVVLIMVLGACLNASTVGPLLSASIVVLAGEFNRPIADITLLTGYNMVVAGASCPLASALATKYGKRPVFFGSSVACLVGTIVGSASQTYHTLLSARIIQGLGFAAYESLAFSVIGDLFFVHQRGAWVNVISFTLSAVSNLSSVIAGPITDHLGWHYLFHILIAASGLQTILCFFFAPETSYIRDASLNRQLAVGDEKVDVRVSAISEHVEAADGSERSQGSQHPTKKTFWQELALYTGVYSEESLLKLVFGPFVCLTNLVALWTVVVTAIITSTYVAISYVVAQLFSPPPYLLSSAQVGYLSAGPFIGGVIGTVLVAQTTDRLVIWMATRNRGVYEPEFRLPLIIFSFICTAGLCGFGALAEAQGNIYAIDVMWGLTLVGICFAVGPCSSYAIDAFRGMSNEIFVANVMVKNFLFFGYSYFINDWITSDGAATPFYVFGGISAALTISTLPVYLFGKRYRSFWHSHNVMEKLGIQGHAEI